LWHDTRGQVQSVPNNIYKFESLWKTPPSHLLLLFTDLSGSRNRDG
jgi:hypothetical protein